MSKVYFTEDHEWIAVDGANGTVGISDYAQEQLGDIVYVEVTRVNAAVRPGDEVAVVESVKAASDIYSPVSGTITEANGLLDSDPETVNADPMGTGWMFRVALTNPDELDGLMDEASYRTFLESL